MLAISELDPDAGFFELGGNSLQATQVTALVEQRLGIKISILELFQNSSVRALSSLIESHRSGESSSSFRGKNALSAESA
ncbi:acyl carrier protein, partial [Enterococcus gallinarum]|uniref:acyl carrier protein n=1 Tax=Enterococcus gallinarum TaxID=1353 RepID=UPI003BED7632